MLIMNFLSRRCSSDRTQQLCDLCCVHLHFPWLCAKIQWRVPPFPPSNDKKWWEKKKIIIFGEKKTTIARKKFCKKNRNMRFCSFHFSFLIISYHWMGGRGDVTVYLCEKCSHVPWSEIAAFNWRTPTRRVKKFRRENIFCVFFELDFFDDEKIVAFFRYVIIGKKWST